MLARFAFASYSAIGSTRCFSTSSRNKALHLMIIGPPGGGKGTQCEKIKRDFGVVQISTGDLLREQIKLGTDIGKRVQSVIKAGGLVDDQTVLGLVEGVMTKPTTIEKGWVLDGYPRTISQSEALERLLKKLKSRIDLVMYLDVPTEVIVDRVSSRLVHAPSGRVYNLQFASQKPKVDGKDDVTGEPLTRRPDDEPETVRRRLEVFYQSTKPVLDFFASRGLLATVPSPTSDIGYVTIKELLTKKQRGL